MADAVAFATTVGVGAGVAVMRAAGRSDAAKAAAESSGAAASASSSSAAPAAAAPRPDLLRIFRRPFLDEAASERLRSRMEAALAPAGGAAAAARIAGIDTEVCFYVDFSVGTEWASLDDDSETRRAPAAKGLLPRPIAARRCTVHWRAPAWLPRLAPECEACSFRPAAAWRSAAPPSLS